MPTVSVLVSTFRPGGIDIILAGLRDQTFKDFEVIIVDKRYDKRHQDVIELANRYGIKTLHVPEFKTNGKWISFCSGWNTAIALAQGDFIIFLCDYTWVPSTWIEEHLNRHTEYPKYVIARYRYTDIPKLKTNVTSNLYDREIMQNQRDRGGYCVDSDDALEGKIFPEMYIFENGPFDPAWIPNLKHYEPPDQDIRINVRPNPEYDVEDGWVHIKNESVMRKFMLAINGLDERLERGKGPMDIDVALRIRKAGARLLWDPNITPAICLDPRWYIRTMPWGDMTQRVEGRWSYDDGLRYNDMRRAEIEAAATPEAKAKALRAKNQYTIEELGNRLASWRDEANHPIHSRDVDDLTYWGREIWPDSE